MTVIKCPGCKGVKVIPRMGGMGSDLCKRCNGIGWINNDDKDNSVQTNDSNVSSCSDVAPDVDVPRCDSESLKNHASEEKPQKRKQVRKRPFNIKKS